MSPATSTKRKLATAEERREAVLKAAIPVFAAHGFHAASTMEIAKGAGISQAYVFRLFPTKAELFVEAYEVAHERMLDTFRESAAEARRTGADPFDEMGYAYGELLDRDKDVLLMQMHGQLAAAGEPLIRKAVRSCFARLFEFVQRETGASEERLRDWFAYGMLCNVMAAIDAEHIDADWARVLAAVKIRKS
jgi:AcrR family transcriptional regulator